MLNIFLIISLFSLVSTKSLHSMEKQQPTSKQHKRLPIPKFNELTSSVKNINNQTSPQKSPSHATIVTTPSNPIVHNPLPTIQTQPTIQKQTLAPKSSHLSTKYSKSARSHPSEKHKDNIESRFSKSDSIIETLHSTYRKKSSISPRPDEIPLIEAVRSCNLDRINDLIYDPNIDPNQQDKNKNTALHHAILQLMNNKIDKENTQKIISLLFLNPAIDSTIMNKYNNIAAQLIKGNDNLPEIRTLLFAQDTLTRWVKRETENIILDSYLYNIFIDDTIIKQSVENVKKEILTTESIQKEQLPETARLQKNITDEFIFKMIEYHLPPTSAKIFKVKQSSELNKINLNELFSQEITNLLSIEESAENILSEINSNNSYKRLVPYITKQSISRKLIILLHGTDSLSDIPNLMFTHNKLIEEIKKEIENTILDSYLNNIFINNEIIKQSVENVKNNIHKTKLAQKQVIELPNYANDAFIFNMITSHMPFESTQLFISDKFYESNRMKLNKLFSQEICNILLNVSVDDTSIKNSAELIMNEISSNKAYKHLNACITKQCILTKLKTHTAQKKPNLTDIFSTMIQETF